MLFNSVQFLVFFPIVTFLYFLLPHAFRWRLLLVASCIFYMAFIPAYILIIFFLVIVDYTAGIKIEEATGPRKKLYLIISIISTCLVLFIFKYFNFFSKEIGQLFHLPPIVSNLVLPVGLSFHTFQSLSYVIEVYFGRQKAERTFGIYALYVFFYPQLVAGPIERPQNLIHQFYQIHRFDYDRVVSGLRLMLWGMFKKVVVADQLAIFVDRAYLIPGQESSLSLIIGTMFFAFQIYYDFSGYSNIAIGAARVMGFDLMTNFNRPYASQSIREFWHRWHISLSTWFRDYIYIPLGGNRVGPWAWIAVIMVTFVLSGLWHGANWTFVVWGALNGFYLVVSHYTKDPRAIITKKIGLTRFPRFHGALKCLIAFTLISISWVFFRSPDMHTALEIFSRIGHGIAQGFHALLQFSVPPELTQDALKNSILFYKGRKFFIFMIALIIFVEGFELYWRRKKRTWILKPNLAVLRWAVYYLLIFSIIWIGNWDATRQFIYFQF